MLQKGPGPWSTGLGLGFSRTGSLGLIRSASHLQPAKLLHICSSSWFPSSQQLPQTRTEDTTTESVWERSLISCSPGVVCVCVCGCIKSPLPRAPGLAGPPWACHGQSPHTEACSLWGQGRWGTVRPQEQSSSCVERSNVVGFLWCF